jgi:hypothetical protein
MRSRSTSRRNADTIYVIGMLDLSKADGVEVPPKFLGPSMTNGSAG